MNTKKSLKRKEINERNPLNHPKKKRKKIEYLVVSDDEVNEEVPVQQVKVPTKKGEPFAIVYNNHFDNAGSHEFSLFLATMRFTFLSKSVTINYSEIVKILV